MITNSEFTTAAAAKYYYYDYYYDYQLTGLTHCLIFYSNHVYEVSVIDL